MPSNNLTVARFVALKAKIGSDEIEGDAPYVFSGTACRPASDGAESGRLSPVRIGRRLEIAKNLDG
jgi:hypothetical protein